jgi:hypothetical protein
MQIKYSQLTNIINSIKKLSSKELPIQTSIKLAKLLKQLNLENEIFANEYRKLFDKYAEKDEKGNIKFENNNAIALKKETIEEFKIKYNELMDYSFNVDFSPISISELKDIQISADDLIALEGFVVD